MFLYQKFNYTHGKVTNLEDMMFVKQDYFDQDKPKLMVFDTETTGLNFMKDLPFLLTFGWGKRVFGVDLSIEDIDDVLIVLYEMMSQCSWVMAHNAKYDYHMMTNFGKPIPDFVNIADSQTIARLTNYADEQFSKSLETMGTMYVDESSKFAGAVIKHKMKEINTHRRNQTKQIFKAEFPDLNFSEYWEQYKRYVPFVQNDSQKIIDRIGEIYQEANYLDVYKEKPELMLSYAYDDIVIMLEWLGKAVGVLKKVDPELVVFKRESRLIAATARQERVGFKVDVDYLLKSRELLSGYRDGLYEELRQKTGIENLTVGQHAVIKKLFERKYNITMPSVDNKNLSKLKRGGDIGRVIELIKTLRTVDKWLSTYIDGFLQRLYNGRIYTSIDLSGAVSGRVSSDMQQQPKEPLKGADGIELYHPRRAILVDDDYELFFFDYSQQELRVQAYYTLLCSTGDIKLLRAYMPFKCTSILTGEEFDHTNKEVLSRWNSGEWVDEEDNIWSPTDVHTETTFTAFPELNRDTNHPDFSHYRKLGKMCNFLKNYQGGIDAIMEQLDVSEEIARVLDRAYYQTFPVIREYQQWVVKELNKKGYVENLYGRRYHMKESKWFYKASNYLIQGSCADMVKDVELRIDDLLKGYKSSFVMPIHDEIIVRVHKDEKHLIKQIKALMEAVEEVPWVPMVCDIENTRTNWADKEIWEEKE